MTLADLLNANPNTLQRRVYNMSSMSFTPVQLAASIRRRIPEFEMKCKPDFRQAIANTWPKYVHYELNNCTFLIEY